MLFGKKLKKTVKIEGMHCGHCTGAVSEALNAIPGVKAKVSLEDAAAYVTTDEGVEDSALTKAVEEAGFKVLSIAEA